VDDEPLVSIGVPTYNRAGMLQRAVESALAQDYLNIEVVISDNASVDGTQAVCEELCRRDSRVRYIRQPINRGPTPNHVEVLTQSCGEYFMFLGDDNWLEPSYVSQCLRTLQAQPDRILVCGRPLLCRGGILAGEGGTTNVLQESGKDRVLSYYRQVGYNTAFFGLARREVFSAVPLLNTMGGDWLYMASIACMGKIETLDSATINISLGGIGNDPKHMAAAAGFSKFQANHQHLSIVISAFKNVVWVSPAYRSYGFLSRFSLACEVALVLVDKFVSWTVHAKRRRYRYMKWLALKSRLWVRS
jgi:glycosyltransferase involved in cell wall biosynthesis